MKYFLIEKSCYKNEKFIIKLNFDNLPKPCNIVTEGSFAVFPARILGLSYADYCRLCRDEFGAIIIGKNSLYPIPYFTSEEEAIRLINILEKYMRF